MKIMKEVLKFSESRAWDQFHNPKDLAMSVSIEAGELLEVFQWKKADMPVTQLVKEKAADEIADVAIYILLLCNKLELDLEKAIADKLEKNSIKYPVELSRGNAKKYTELE